MIPYCDYNCPSAFCFVVICVSQLPLPLLDCVPVVDVAALGAKDVLEIFLTEAVLTLLMLLKDC